MYPFDNNFIYTPPEIIAREVKKEFSTPKTGNGVPKSKSLRRKLMWIEIGMLTSPIWVGLAFLLICKSWFGL